MIINNGIINQGNGNTNINDSIINYEEILNEITILQKHTTDDLGELKNAAMEKNKSKLIFNLKKIKKETIKIIRDLGLSILEMLIEYNVFK